MTPKEKEIAISGYLPHGLKVAYGNDYDDDKNLDKIGYLVYNRNEYKYSEFSINEYLSAENHIIKRHGITTIRFKPILFPIDYLHKEIIIKGYNNGDPFVPILELAKMYSDTIHVDKIEGCVNNYSYFKCWFENGFEELIISNKLDAWYRSYFDKNQPNTGRNIVNQLKCHDLLNSWFIDYRGLIEKGEAISVLDINENLYVE